MRIDNSRKGFGGANAKGIVSVLFTNIECTLLITTEQAASGTGWYSQKITMPIDRAGSGNIYEYETFFY